MSLRSGFTLPELILVMGIAVSLLVVTTVNLLGVQHKASLTTTVDTIIADVKSQQTKAMAGDTEGRPTADHYGLYFESDRYTLFHGPTYSVSDPDNTVINLEDDIVLSPTSSLVFQAGSGEILNYNSNSLTISNSNSSETKTLEFNQYGVIVFQI